MGILFIECELYLAMIEPRLKAGIFVSALIRRVEIEGASAFVLHKGDETAGAVLLVLNRLDGTAHALGAATDMDGKRIWRSLLGEEAKPEAEVSALVARERGRDSDLWVVEIEDRQGRAFVDEIIHWI